MMKLGKQLENPYSIENMKLAINKLYPTRSAVDLEPTHLYVRFLPKDSTELRLLDEEFELELFDFPLDYEILEEGTYYHDTEVPESKITWQYTTVKPDFTFPSSITYEIIEECYIPNDEDNIEDEETRANLYDLESKAFELAGATDKFNNDIETRSLKRYRPTGTIQVYDDKLNKLVGVKGVKIRCHLFVKWSTAFTDENGKYSMDSRFRIGPHYAVVFDNTKGFDLYCNWGSLARANYNMGWHSKKGHNRNFYKNSVAWDWCSVNNAGYDYYKLCEREGVYKPPSTLKIWVFRHKDNISCAPMLNKLSATYGFKANNNLANFFSAFFLST